MASMTEIHDYIRAIGVLDTAAVKIASDENGCILAQKTAATASDGLYSIMRKEAGLADGADNVTRMCDWADKFAAAYGKKISEETRLKLAAAIAVDESIHESDDPKLAEARFMGREFILELLRKAV